MAFEDPAWYLLLLICAAMFGFGSYLCFFGLSSEQRRAKLIYTLVLSVFVLWILPILVSILNAATVLSPEAQVSRGVTFVFGGLGIGLAMFLSNRYSSYVFRIVCASIGVLAGLAVGTWLRVGIGLTGQFAAILVPIAFAVAFGLYGWSRGGDIRNSGKILYFSATGSTLATSGVTAAVSAWYEDDPGSQIIDLILSTISPLINYMFFKNLPSLGEIAMSFAIWTLFLIAGIAWQCYSLQAREPDESSICGRTLRFVKLK